MSHPTGRQSPVVRFLGEDAGRGGPFALLGLPHAVSNERDIDRAVQLRLQQIDRHQHRSTPDAGEVRLAVHSAASQLRDPALRAQLAQRWPEGKPVDAPRAWTARIDMQKLTPGLLRRARMVVGSSGGWNAHARRRLAHLARLNRVSAMDVIRALARSSPSAGPRAPTGPAAIRLAQPPGPSGWVYAYAVLGLLACGLLLTVLLQPQRDLPLGTSGNNVQSRTNQATSPGVSRGPITAPREQLTHYTAIAHELDRLVARAALDPDIVIRRFREVYPRFVAEWTSFPPDALQRAGINIAELIVRLEQAGVPPERLAPILASAGTAPDRVMIGAGVIDVTLASPSLSSQSRAVLRVLRTRISDATITPSDQLRAAIITIAMHQAQSHNDDSERWWASWLSGAMHAAGENRSQRTRLVLAAMSARLRDPEEPGQAWREIVTKLLGELEWRAGSDERYWLLAQFGDDQVSTPRLSMLTEALAASSSAEGVDARMVLASNANRPQREQLAKSYEDAWFGRDGEAKGGSTDTDRADLITQLRVAITRLDPRVDDERAIRHTLTIAAYSTAAELDMQGEVAASTELILNPPEISNAAPSDIGDLLRSDSEADAWAEQAVNSERDDQLRPLIDQLLARDTVRLNEAHALVYLASTKPERDLRELALAQLVRSRDQVSVLMALDHALEADRVSSRLDALAEQVLGTDLPDRGSAAAWYRTARRLVLTRIAEAMAELRSEPARSLQRELAYLLELRVGMHGMQDDQASNDAASLLQELNRATRLRLDAMDDLHTELRAALERSEAHAGVMRLRAPSPMAQYLHELVYELELRRIEVNARYPGIASRVERDSLEHERRMNQAGSVLQQIAHTHRAIAQLHAIELERRTP